VIKNRYDNHSEVLDYSKHSANPIGRLLLHLTHQDTPEYLKASDALCTALQLINILNDIEHDWHTRNRCYLPLDEMHTLGLSVEDLADQNPITSSFQVLIAQQLDQIVALLAQSQALWTIPGRLGFEIRLVVYCAKRMIQKLQSRKNLNEPLKLNYWDWFSIVLAMAVAKKQKPC
jgi:phytoene/squalene synthetase